MMHWEGIHCCTGTGSCPPPPLLKAGRRTGTEWVGARSGQYAAYYWKVSCLQW